MAYISADKLKKLKYGIDLRLVLPYETEPIYINDFLTNMNIYSFYEKNVFPIVQLELTLRHDVYKLIQMYSDEIVFVLSINRYEVQDKDDNDALVYDVYIKDEILKPIDIPKTPLRKVETEASDKSEPSTNTDPDKENDKDNAPDNTMIIPCFFNKHLELNKEKISGCINNSTLQDAILYLLNKGGASNVLMSEVENTEIQEQIFFPTITTTSAIKYMQEVYGVYSYGIVVFFDIKWSYILQKDFLVDPPVAEGGNDEWDTVYLELVDPADSSLDVYGTFADEENKRFNIKLIDKSEFVGTDSSSRELNGEAVKFLSRSRTNHNIQRFQETKFGTDPNEDKVINGDKSKEVIMWNNYNNPFAETQYQAKMASKQLQVKIPWQDIDLDVLTLNRKYQLIFSDDEYSATYNGTYRLDSTVISFNKGKSEKYFRLFGVSVFDKLHKSMFNYGISK